MKSPDSRDDAIVKNHAADGGVAFADWGSVQFDGPSGLLDFAHPNKSYSDRLVVPLGATLAQAGPERAVATESLEAKDHA